MNPANLSVTKTASAEPATLNQPLTYTMVVTNFGPFDATGVMLTDTLPSGVTLESVAPSQGSCSGSTPVSCSLGGLANGASATVTIVVTPNSAGIITNAVNVYGNEPDLVPSSNTASTPSPRLVGNLTKLSGLQGKLVSLTGWCLAERVWWRRHYD